MAITVQDLRFHKDVAQCWGIVCPMCHYADTFVKRVEATDAKREHVCAGDNLRANGTILTYDDLVIERRKKRLEKAR